MKKIIIAFAVGQAMQLVLLWVALSITYTASLLPFCAAAGAVVTLALVIGSLGSLLELAVWEPEDPTADADEEIRKGEQIKDHEWPTIFRRGWDKKPDEKEADGDV